MFDVDSIAMKYTMIIINFIGCFISVILLSISLSKKLLLNKFKNQKFAILIPLWITIFLPLIGLFSFEIINYKYPWIITVSVIISYIIVVTLVGLNSYIVHEFKESKIKKKTKERKNIRHLAIVSLMILILTQITIILYFFELQKYNKQKYNIIKNQNLQSPK